MSTANAWDVIVVGGGPAGENAAQYAIQGSGRTAVIVEAALLALDTAWTIRTGLRYRPFCPAPA